MRSTILCSLPLAGSLVAAANIPFEKRQGKPAVPELPAGGDLGALLGSAGATEYLIQVAETLGAGPGKPGGMADFVKQTMNAGVGKVADPPGAAPKRVVMKPRGDLPGLQTVKIRYGPYKLPSAKSKNMAGEYGMLYNYPELKIEKPCQGDCTIVGINAGLEHPDGKDANTDTGLWLHHYVLFSAGPGRQDATCGDREISIPHIMANETSKTSERFFSSGNERTPVSLPAIGVKNAGYKISDKDHFSMIADLMNQNDEEKVVYLTQTWDFVPGHPAGWDHVRPVWLDVAQCGTSELTPPTQDSTFMINGTWTANFDGEVLTAGGHLHDGGSKVILAIEGKDVCDSEATYEEPKPKQATSSAPPPPGGHSHGGDEPHIREMSRCTASNAATMPVKKGQKWDIKAYYDYKAHGGMMHDGAQDKVMGIAIMYVRVKQ